MAVQTWIILSLFIINLLFVVIMSFVSPFYNSFLIKGSGKILNILWLVIIIALSGVFFFFNSQCILSRDFSVSCNVLSYMIVGVLAIVTTYIIVFSVLKDIKYRKQMAPKQINQETK